MISGTALFSLWIILQIVNYAVEWFRDRNWNAALKHALIQGGAYLILYFMVWAHPGRFIVS